MPNLEWNLATWDRTHPWEADGDEWSQAWGGPRAQWLGTIYPRISRFLPATRILEVAPGRGRWTQFLLPQCTEYFGVDISEACIRHCVHRFASASRAHFVVNDGRSLAMVPNESIDFVFSFDSLVHAELDVVREYTWQIAQKLSATGVAFLHHSNAASPDADAEQVRRNFRAETVSATVIKDLFEDVGCKVLVQEEICWGGTTRIDCLTTCCKGGAYSAAQYVRLINDDFMAEAGLVRRNHAPYHAL